MGIILINLYSNTYAYLITFHNIRESFFCCASTIAAKIKTIIKVLTECKFFAKTMTWTNIFKENTNFK